MSDKSIEKNSEVSIDFSLTLVDGTPVDGTQEDKPLEFTLGDGTMIEPFEEAILGLKIGEENKVQLEPRETFGFVDESNYHWIEKEKFSHLNASQQKFEVGLLIDFDTPDGNQTTGQVIEMKDNKVLIDFNHPLCGQELIFDVKVLDIN